MSLPQQPVWSSASPATPDNDHNVGRVSSPTEYKHIYLFLFEQDPLNVLSCLWKLLCTDKEC